MRSSLRIIGRLATTVVGLWLSLATVALAQTWKSLPDPGPMPKPAASGYVAVGDVRLYYATYGAGPPLLLIHNGLGSADDWAQIVPRLTKRYRVVVADTRGFGRSTRDATPYSYDLLASDYLHLLDALGIRRVLIVGTSDGADIGLDLAIHHPDRVAGLFAQGANATLDGAAEPSDMAAIRLAAARSKVEYRRLSPTPEDYPGLRAAMGRMYAVEPAFSTSQLASIRAPTAIVVADHEESITPAHSAYLARTIPHAQLVTLHDVSHFAPLQDPSQFADAVWRFAAGVPSWAGRRF
jgi:pimeloyl-ACP methyl ester carboxylesterase